MASPVLVELRASISDFQAKMAEARAEMDKTGESSGGLSSKITAFGGAAAAGLAGAAVALGGFALDMADKFEPAHASLVAAIQASGGTYQQYAKQVTAADGTMAKFGFNQTQVQAALAVSVVSTQSTTKSLGLLGLAADLAKMKHTDLSSAMGTLDKALTGNLRPLKQMGIDLPITATSALKLQQASDAVTKAQDAANAILAKTPDAANAASKAHAGYEAALNKVTAAQAALSAQQSASGSIMDALTQRLGGQAAAAAATFGGKLAALKAQGEDFATNIGMKLIPILQQLMTTVMNVVTWLEKHRTVAMMLAAAIAAVVVPAIVAWAASMVAAAAATVAAAAPVIAIIAAVAALAAGVIYAYTHWAWFRDTIKTVADFITNTLWPLIKQFGQTMYDVADFIAEHWKAAVEILLVVVLGPLGVAVDLVATHFKTFKAVATDVWDTVSAVIKTVWGVIQPIFDTLWHIYVEGLETGIAGLQGAWNTAWQVVTTAVQTAWNIIKPILDLISKGISAVTGAVSGISGAVGSIGHVGGSLLSHIGLAQGGPVLPGQTVTVGEKGPETFTASQAGYVNANSQGGGSGVNIYGPIYISVPTLDANSLARQLRQMAGMP